MALDRDRRFLISLLTLAPFAGRNAAAYRAAASEEKGRLPRGVVRIVGGKEFGDINISTLLSLMMIAGPSV